MGVNCDTCTDQLTTDFRDKRQMMPAKFKPPFRQLPDPKVTAMILSYMEYEEELKWLLDHISTDSRKFLRNQHPILRKNYISYEPWIREVIEFGEAKYQADCVYPSEN